VPLPADTPTLSLLEDAKRSLERRPAPAPAPAAPASSTACTPVVPPPVAAPALQPTPTPTPRQPATPALQPALARVPEQDPSEAVFADFVARFTRIADDEPVVARELAAALADPRLLNLEARTAFEGRVAQLVMGGWKPGHEFLFKPACDAFDWERDRRRLEIYGPLGAALDAAVRERLVFLGQPAIRLDPQRKLVRRLRTDRPTRPAEIAPSIQMLSMLLQRYPNWMRAMTRQDVVQHWITTWNEFTTEQRQAGTASWQGRTSAGGAAATRMPPPARPFKPARSSGRFSPFAGVWIVAMVIGALPRLFTTSDSSPAHPYQPPPAARVPALKIPSWPDRPAPLPASHFPPPDTRNVPDQNPPAFGNDDPAGPLPSPAEQARRQRLIDQLARRQAQIDAMNAKRALGDGSGQGSIRDNDPGGPLPDPGVGTTPAQ
jgi:protein TonB